MDKSIFTKEYAIFLSNLRLARKAAGLTQEQMAKRLHQTQSFVSKCERGERRIDTEITARFRDSQTHFQANQTKVAILCWMLEDVLSGKPKIIDIWIGDGLEVAKTRDDRYHNPPHYIVVEPEDTRKRTRNLQQTNCHGYIFQGTDKQLAKAVKFVDLWGDKAKEYSPARDYQMRLRELTGNFPYRLDTNFAKMDRICLPSLEKFKADVLASIYEGCTIQSWIKAVSTRDTTALQQLIDPSDPNLM